MGNALVLGGGAPNMTLMSGALLELHKAGVKFEVVSTSGAGMLIGLLYAAARGMGPEEALDRTQDLGVSDWIYNWFPMNYKVFHKPGPLAEMYTQMMAKFTPPRRPQNDFERFMVDWWQLGAALMCPTDLNAMSKGLCQPAPWIDQVVDFDKLKKYPGDFYLSAYCIEDREHVTFDKEEITGEHFKASLAMPFIYSPYKMDGKTYLEGAAQDALNYKGLIESIEKNEKKDQRKIENIIVFDVLGLDKTVGEPRNLYDAWVKSIIVPLVAIAQDDTTLFQRLHNVVRYPDGSLQRDEHGNPVENRKLLKVQFSEHMPEEQWPKVYDWSYSNLSTLFEVGRNAGKAFVKNNHAALFPEAETAA